MGEVKAVRRQFNLTSHAHGRTIGGGTRHGGVADQAVVAWGEPRRGTTLRWAEMVESKKNKIGRKKKLGRKTKMGCRMVFPI
jgi:hypothetical protein